jgi:RHS repeat-associated protein
MADDGNGRHSVLGKHRTVVRTESVPLWDGTGPRRPGERMLDRPPTATLSAAQIGQFALQPGGRLPVGRFARIPRAEARRRGRRHLRGPPGALAGRSHALSGADAFSALTRAVARHAGCGRYYGFRYCAPSMGRWVTRDPIAETGGISLHAFSGNDVLDQGDFLGLRGAPVRQLLPDVFAHIVIEFIQRFNVCTEPAVCKTSGECLDCCAAVEGVATVAVLDGAMAFISWCGSHTGGNPWGIAACITAASAFAYVTSDEIANNYIDCNRRCLQLPVVPVERCCPRRVPPHAAPPGLGIITY